MHKCGRDNRTLEPTRGDAAAAAVMRGSSAVPPGLNREVIPHSTYSLPTQAFVIYSERVRDDVSISITPRGDSFISSGARHIGHQMA